MLRLGIRGNPVARSAVVEGMERALSKEGNARTEDRV